MVGKNKSTNEAKLINYKLLLFLFIIGFNFSNTWISDKLIFLLWINKIQNIRVKVLNIVNIEQKCTHTKMLEYK